MKNSKPRVEVSEDADRELDRISAECDVPKQRLRGLAIEYSVAHSEEDGDFTEFVYREEVHGE